MIIRKAPAEIDRMARAGAVVADTLALIGERARPGITTEELDELADDYIRSRGGVPTFKGYRGYPASICTSPNDMVVHGIPGPYTLGEGDLLSVDVGVTLDGFVADSAYTFPIGEVSPEAERLLEGCQAALAAGIEQCRIGNRLSDISHAIQRVTEEHGYSVVRSLVGQLVELLRGHARPGVLADQRERLGDDFAGAGHALDLSRGLADDHRTATCSSACWISRKTCCTGRSAWMGTKFPRVRKYSSSGSVSSW